MNIYGGQELAAALRRVRANTIRIAEDIPEEQSRFTAAADTRSIGQVLAHVAVGPGFQLTLLERLTGVRPHLTRESQVRMARAEPAAAQGR